MVLVELVVVIYLATMVIGKSGEVSANDDGMMRLIMCMMVGNDGDDGI